MFEKFPTSASVGQLLTWLWDKQYQLPRPASSDGLTFEMVDANYTALLDLLQNPVYAGLYAYPRFRTETIVLPDGTVRKKTRRTRPSEWEVRREGNHPAYIDIAQYEAHQEKIAMNAKRSRRPVAVRPTKDGPCCRA